MLRFLSFRGLLLAGFLGVALIPSAALVQLRHELGLAADSAQLHQRQAQRWQDIARLSQEQAVQFERASRQAAILRDRKLTETASQARGELQRAQRTLRQDAPAEAQAGIDSALALASQLQRLPPDRRQQRDALFRQLNRVLDQQQQTLAQAGEKRQASWRDDIERMRLQANRLAWLALAAAVLLALIVTLLIHAPLRGLQRRIARLAGGARQLNWRQAGPADLQRLGRELEQLDLRLVELEQQKTRFFRQVSHELKTPLASIHEAAALLKEQVAGPLNPQQRHIVDILGSNAQTLRQRVEALLKQDAGLWLSTTLNVSAFPLRQLLEARLASCQPLWQAKRLEVELDGAPGAVRGDPSKVETIVDNLLLNAIRHSPAGGRLTLRCGSERGQAWLEVADQGPGVPDALRDKIFEPFWSGPAPDGERPGSGLGLTMARGYAQLMGGELRLLDDGPGARFRLHWPEPEPI
ncbi:ATP-binding protein [Chromobacterium piscinae]|uniref:histidine kinase n=1 Tax=Chromobacterium piscinae TaxID=686831 RepID=A0ABV0H6U5_9NEIS|nr:HAMP domain-containing sensor histidine kinase [Chromobacterium piscinae]MBX9296180.1 HAMP domain-containing histidine kinase [Chromobacterium vaccinii]MBX9356503.1 HAMP domain-containing histidine kinase [Chromobacterium vaccinii]MCD4506058.1 HAMP domain-containing histidine kinase [Chromobacterium piscinae]MCD5326175.1 HAMP domain-containing histidine kinase [Chromobacterium piscinae]NHQ83012.1 HAMP domain-containing histidine kinase [Chromobacterium vaccinii]